MSDIISKRKWDEELLKQMIDKRQKKII